MQTAGYFIRGGVEFAAGVQLGKHHLARRDTFAAGKGHFVHGNAAAVVDDGDRIVHMDGDFDAGGVAVHGFVDGVVDNLIHQVVQPHLPGRANVHGGAQANGLQTLQHLDVVAGVFIAGTLPGGGLGGGVGEVERDACGVFCGDFWDERFLCHGTPETGWETWCRFGRCPSSAV